MCDRIVTVTLFFLKKSILKRIVEMFIFAINASLIHIEKLQAITKFGLISCCVLASALIITTWIDLNLNFK